MKILEVKPSEGIGRIKLGMERDEVYRIFGKSGDLNLEIEWIDDYHIGYENGKVVFIEIPNSISPNNFVLFNGVDVFRTEAKLLVKVISEYGQYDESDRELGFSYTFSKLGIALWRPSIFEYEMIYDSSFKEMDKEIQLDEMKYLYFEAVSVFVKDYFKRKDD